MFVDPRPPKKQVISCTSIYNMKTSDCSYRTYNEVNVDIAKSKRCTFSRRDTLIGCSRLSDVEEFPPPQVLL